MSAVCASCGSANPGDARFCSACGVPLRPPCASCGARPPADAAACPACGARFGLGPALHERKTATILYADLVGSTSVGERLDVEAHQDLMTEYFSAMRFEAETTGGTVEQFVGDAVLAVYGVPTAREDDADRAVEAAHRMVNRLQWLNSTRFSRHGLELQLRIGINTGEVVTAGPIDVGALTGDALNVAARLAGHARAGGILVSETTARAVRAHRLAPAGTVELRGRTRPVATFEPAGDASTETRRAALPQAPIIGRDHELALLATLRERVESERAPHLVTIYGPAGIGKSRLQAEFAASAARGAAPMRALFGRCRPYGEDAAFGAFSQILAILAGIREGDPDDRATECIGTLVDRLAADGLPAPEGVAHVLAYAAGVGARGSPLADQPARQVRSAIRDAWRWLLSAEAARNGLVVVIEDLHWADPAFLDMLEHLADRVDGPVLFLCPARPALLDTRPGWGGGRRGFSSIVLGPLSENEGQSLVEWYVGAGLSADLGRLVLDRAEGNPYFIEEILRGLADEGSLVHDDGGWRMAGDVTEIHIPHTVQAVIAARIDLLELAEKRVLQCAAVVGRTFWTGAIAHLLGVAAPEVEEALDRLEGRELVLAGHDSALSGEREYRFKHTLVRQVAYDGLARRDRSALHLAVADWIAAEADGARREIAGIEAHHLALAYDGMRSTSPDGEEIDRLRVRAIEALLSASEYSRRRVALGQARYYAREARRFAVDPIEASRAAEALGEAYFYGYEGDPAWRALREAIELRLDGPAGPDPEIARLCARALQLPVRWPGAMQQVPEELTALRYLYLGMDHAPPRSEEAVRLLLHKGFWQHAFPRRDGEGAPDYLVTPEESLRSAEQAVKDAAEMDRPDLESAALDAVTAYYIPRGLYSAAWPATRRRLDLIGDLHDLWEIGDTYAMQGWLGYHTGAYREAFERSDEGFARTVTEAPSLALHCLKWRCLARFRLGDWRGVRRDLAIARDLLGEYREDPPHFVSQAFAVTALVHEYRGEHVAADALLEVLSSAYARRPEGDRDVVPLGQWAEFVAPVLARRDRLKEARRLLAATTYRRRGRLGLLFEARLEVAAEGEEWDLVPSLVGEARAIAAEGGLQALPVAADLLEGRALHAGGDLGPAIEILGIAVAGFDRLEARWDGARARVALATALLDAGFPERALTALAPALPVFEDLGARRELDSAREIAAAAS